MNISISAHINNNEKGDDCLFYDEINDNAYLVVLCDGVSSSYSGKVASNIITTYISLFANLRADILRANPPLFMSKVVKGLNRIFRRLHLLIDFYNRDKEQSNHFSGDSNIPVFAGDELTEFSISEETINEYIRKYAGGSNIELQEFERLIKDCDSGRKFCSTMSLLFFEDIEHGYYKVTVVNLGDGFVLKTSFDKESGIWSFKDLAFTRSTDGKTSQFDSREYVKGEIEISVFYVEPNSIITIGSDGSRIKRFDYPGKPLYQNENFREFSEMLYKSALGNSFQDSSLNWHNHLKNNNGIGDDFSLISILLP